MKNLLIVKVYVRDDELGFDKDEARGWVDSLYKNATDRADDRETVVEATYKRKKVE